MGFVQPDLPTVDHDEWNRLDRAGKMRPLAEHYARSGFGSPDVLVLFYVLKVALYALIGWGLVLGTPGIDGALTPSDWFRQPEAFFKMALFTMLWEVLGLGCGFGPLNGRFLPPLGTFLYWLRPGTIRLAPFRGRLPGTGGDTRTVLDVVLYAAFVIATLRALWGPMDRSEVALVVALLVIVGLRDQVVFLAARGEVYGPMAIAYLFADGDRITAAKLALLVIWWGAAVSKLNRHFPSVLAAMLANSPFWRVGGLTRRLWRDHPDDLRPSALPTVLSHIATAVEFAAPAVLLFATGGPILVIAAVLIIGFHLGILSSVPMGVPLEWNVFMIWGVITLHLGHPGFPPHPIRSPVPIAALIAVMAFFVVLGNLRPDRVSFLPSMRYYAGNWATTIWCLTDRALERIEQDVVAATMLPHRQLETVYGDADSAAVPLVMGYVFRGFHAHGPALWTLADRACPGLGDPDPEHLALDGEFIAGLALGWNFGDGHLHAEPLADALHRRCRFEPGEVRIAFLESQPIQRQQQEYRLLDAATGCFERGFIEVADLLTRQPTDADVPLHVTWSATPASPTGSGSDT